MDRIPHIWCPGCGIGTVVTSFVEGVRKEKIDLDDIAIVSGIGCTGRVAGYVKFDSFHTTHGRALAFATGLKLGSPRQKVVVFSGDGDLTGIGGNHFIHAARRNMDMIVICINNFNYAMTGGQVAPTSPSTPRCPPPLSAISSIPSASPTSPRPPAPPTSRAGRRCISAG